MSAKKPPRAIVLLGAQRFDPTLGDAVRAVGVEGSIATITAGWQEREDEDLDLDEHLQGRTVNLRLHRRTEEVLARDPELRTAHRDKQSVLRHKQDFYRIRLEHELDAHHTIFRRHAPSHILAEERTASLAAIRALDEYHLAQCERVHREFEEQFRPEKRPALARHRDELRAVLERSTAVAIAGGHVATLINRLRLFGIEEMIDGHAIFAWCAGAMAVCDRVVLFHDSPPQGQGAPEVLDRALCLRPGVVPLPQPETRLKLDDPERVAVMAARFGPARCLCFPARSWVAYVGDTITHAFGALELLPDGSSTPLGPPPPAPPPKEKSSPDASAPRNP